jgi:DNA-binding Lrp family transcriptional regulator
MFSELDKALIRELQEDLPVTARPYQAIAAKLGISEEEVVAKVAEFKEKGYIRRFGAALKHREAGFTANGMGCWIVPEEKSQEIGEKMASFPEVSHCYERPCYPDWPYSHFTMIHGESRQECEAVAKRISEATGISDYILLYSTQELKKTSMRYFREGEES